MSTSSPRPVSRVSSSIRRTASVHLTARGLLFSLLLAVSALAQALPGGPLTLSELRTLSASDGAANAYFGSAVSVSGNLAAVGAYGADSGRGAVYIYARNQGGADQWQQVRKIRVTGGEPGDHFGFAVSLSGDTLAVGAPDSDEWGADAGMVSVFERNMGGADQWGLLCQVADTEVTAGDRFGYSVSLDLNLLAVGAHNDQVNGLATGAAYVFHRNYGNGWFRKVMRLTAPDGAAGDRFGIAVAVSYDRVVVGAHQDDNEGGVDAGAAYVFWRDQGGYNQWGLLRKLRGETAEDGFGAAVAIDGSWVLVGAPFADGGGGPFGRAYLYERNQNGADGWGLVKTLNPAGVTGTPRFGCAVALDAHRAVVGASNDTEGGVATGALHVYARDAGGFGNWGQIQRVVGQDAAAGDFFGTAVALDGDAVVVGMHGDDPQGETSGTARVLACSGNRWFFEQKLIHVNPEYSGRGDAFGASVSLKGDRLAAGSSRLANITGGNSTAMVYERRQSGQTLPWSPQKELKGHLTWVMKYDWAFWEDDGFGQSVGVDGEELAVGAPEDGPTETFEGERGMTYFYARNEGGASDWARVGQANQHTRHAQEEVGGSLAIDHFTTVLGSRAPSRLAHWVDGKGGNAYLYCRDIGGLSSAWTYLRRFELWKFEGVAVALSGNLLAIGIPVENVVYLHDRNQGGKDQWGLVATLHSPSSNYVGDFGGRVAVSGDTVAVGPVAFAHLAASVFIFQRNEGGADQWGVVREIPGEPWSNFGCDLALDGNTLVVGASTTDYKTGVVYVYERNAGWADHWGEVARLTAPDARPDSWFGSHVSVNGGLLAVGAPGDDEYDLDAGAVYTFVLRANRAPTMGAISGADFTRSTEDEPLDTMPTARAGSVVALAQTSDPDGDVCGMAVIGIEGAGGKWQFSGDGEHWNNFGGASSVNARLLGPDARIRFVPEPDFTGAVRPGITFRAWDQTTGFSTGIGDARQFGGATAFSEQSETWGWEVAPANDRPVLSTTGSPRLPDIWGNILDQYNLGQSVSNLLRGLVTDIDGDVCGLAVTGVSETSGRWQYSTDAGANWRPLTASSALNARLLDPAARIRFVPNHNYVGTVSGGLLFMAWDQTTGSNGGLGNTQAGTAFSTGTQTFSITVTPIVNHAPLLDAFGDPVLPTIPRNATFNAGVPVADLLGDWAEDVDGDACGLALTQTDTAHGAWQYSRNDGMTWSEVGAVSMSSALLLGPDAIIRFVPALNYTGTVSPAIQYRAWDQTSGNEGSRVDARNGGGDLAYSLVIEPAPITVSSEANHAPTLAVNNLQLWLPDIQEDDSNPAGDVVGGLLANGYTDQDGNLCGIAVYAQDARHGVWQYRGPKDVLWLPMGTVSASAARLLGPTTQVRFVPEAGYTGTVLSGLSFRAWDRSAGTNGSLANLSPNGGATPYSTRTGLIGARVVAVNDAPVLLATGSLALAPLTENEFNHPGTLVSDLINRLVSDADRDVCGIAVIGLNEANGVWQYSLDAGAHWTPFGTFRANYGRLLGPTARVRLVPDVDFHGKLLEGARLRAWDQTSGTNGGLGLIVQPGGRSAYSERDRWASIEVKELNRPPSDLALDNASVFENQPGGTQVGRLSATDPNAGDTHTFALVAGAGAEDNALFAIQGNELRTAAVLDREAQATRTVRVEVRDGAGNTLARAFVIAVTDQSDTAPSDLVLWPGVVAENQPAGAVVGQLVASDGDAGDTHTFALVAGDGSEDNGSFVIDGNTVKTAAVFDYETKAAYAVRIQADDGHGGRYARSLAILVLDEDDNEAPWHIALNSTCLPQGTPWDRAVGVLTAFDLNRDDVHTFALVSGEGDTDNGSFRIDGPRLYTNAQIDFAAHGPYRVRVQADDGHGGKFQRTFTIVEAEVVWHDAFESGWGEWTHSASQGADTWDIREEAARSPTHCLTATGTSAPSDSSAESPWVKIPEDAQQVRFQFFQRRAWGEFNPVLVDGGVLEYRREGEGWWDILAGDTRNSWVIGAYQSEAPGPLEEPLAERLIWSGVSTGFFEQVTLALDAGSLAGRSVQFRWRQVVNSGVVERRWHVDDVLLVVARPYHPPLVLAVALTAVTDQVELAWASVPGRQYVIEACADLGTLTWAPVSGPVTGAAGVSTTSVLVDLGTLPGHPRSQHYFRVKAL